MSLSYQAALQEPVLGAKQERVAIRNWQQKGDRKSLEILVRSHARMVWSQALSWSNNPVHLEDLVAEGIIGLMQAANNFDLTYRVRFSAYAKWWVSASISAALSRVKIVIDIPARIYMEACGNNAGGEKSACARIAARGAMSLDATAQNSENQQLNILRCPELNPEERALAKSSSMALAQTLYHALETLNPMEQEVIKRLKLKAQPDCAGALAREFKMSRAKLRQIERHAVMRLRKALPRCGFHLEMLT